jgi:hypothetical protein
MRKVALVLGLTALLFSCKKENKKCNCGEITNDNIEFDGSGNMYYTLTIKNDCSGNSGKYYFDYNVWLDANVGENFCVTNVSSWIFEPTSPTTSHSVDNKSIN